MTNFASPLSLSIGNGIACIRFTRPDMLNAIDSATAEAFLTVCRRIAQDPSVRVVTISGAGRAFMAGGDIAEFGNGPEAIADTLITPMADALRILTSLPAPVIASVHGPVAGAGMSLALACDLVIASDTSRFKFAYVHLGTSCDLGASWSLPRTVGLHRALAIALLSEPIDAREAERLGIVHCVVSEDVLMIETEALARRLAAGAPLAHATLKKLMRESLSRTFSEQLDAEREAFKQCAATAHFNAAVSAFLEKRRA